MKYFLLFLFIICVSQKGYTQMLDSDSIFRKIDSKFSPVEAEKMKKEYEAADDATKAMMLNIFSMPMSSKKELIENYEDKRKEIEDLKKWFNKMIPKKYIVFLELKESDKIPGLVEALDLQIFEKDNSGDWDMVHGDWDLRYGSEELNSLLNIIGWDEMTLLGFKNIMQTANCISIQNGNITEIGFARSGLGKYYYLLFPNKLKKEEIDKYNDGCEYIYYKNNVVLKYVGGMAGPQCFTD